MIFSPKAWDLLHWVNMIPNNTYPGGRHAYEAIKLHYRDDTFFGRGWSIAWWRQVWHGIGGMVVTLPFLAGPPWIMNLVPLGIAALVMTKEIFNDSEGHVSMFNKKNLIDTVCWTMGSTILVVLVQ